MCMFHLLLFRYVSHALAVQQYEACKWFTNSTWLACTAKCDTVLAWVVPALLSTSFSCCRPACTAFKHLTSGNAPRQ